jgi:hypothetical protein
VGVLALFCVVLLVTLVISPEFAINTYEGHDVVDVGVFVNKILHKIHSFFRNLFENQRSTMDYDADYNRYSQLESMVPVLGVLSLL